MKMNKILLAVALLVSARAFAWQASVPAFAKSGYAVACKAVSTVAASTRNGASYVWNKLPAISTTGVKTAVTSSLTSLKNAGSTASKWLVANRKVALASTAAVAVVAGLAFVGKKALTKKAATDETVA